MRAFWKRFSKVGFQRLPNNWMFRKKSKLRTVMWQSVVTKPSTPRGISGKTMFVSLFWYPGMRIMSRHFLNVALWRRWPSKRSGRKRVILPYPLACPWHKQQTIQMVPPQKPKSLSCVTELPFKPDDNLNKPIQHCAVLSCAWNTVQH